jgi:heat shock protein HslJ
MVMAPMTRSRSSQPGDVGNELMARYYAERSGAGGSVAVAIQSMDDAQGTTPSRWTTRRAQARWRCPSHFTLAFGRDGRAALRLDCNRGSGDYKVAPAGDGSSGSLTFGPIATTRAMCPPPHLDQRVARDLAHVRSYLLKDGKLYLSLMADGGIYEWAPQQAGSCRCRQERIVKPVQFAKGKNSAVIRDRVVGHHIDYQCVPAPASA